ncbi:MAG TPA: YtxH domain-containing protein [Candidatus Baltobacteraceae bacterium]|jgi:gas vesicle protein|nr:YtxH domain-containing protein [Candidatus Baltobacteraceae bacterium]
MNNEPGTPQPGGGSGFFTGLVIGVLAGAALAYFIMQEEARDAIVGKAREAANSAMDATGDLRGRVADVAGTLQENAADLYARGKNVVDSARSNVNAAVDEGQATAGRVRDELSQEAQSVPQPDTRSQP